MKKYAYYFGVLVLASILLAAAAIAALPDPYYHWWEGKRVYWWTYQPTVTSLLLNPLPLARGATGTLTLTIDPPQSSDTVVPLTIDFPALAQVPTSVNVPSGQTQAKVSVTGLLLGNATVTATLNGVVQSTVQVQCPSPRARVDWDPVNGAKVTLNLVGPQKITPTPQQGNFLCWAANAEMAMSLWSPPVPPSQCQQVIDALHPAMCSCPPPGTPPPWDWLPTECDTTGEPRLDLYGFTYKLGSFFYQAPGPAGEATTPLLSTWEGVTDQICENGSPILYSYQIHGGGQHMFVVYGYHEDGGVQKVLSIDPENVDLSNGNFIEENPRFDEVFLSQNQAWICAVVGCEQFPVLEYYDIQYTPSVDKTPPSTPSNLGVH